MTRSSAIAAQLLGSSLLMVLAGCSSVGIGRPKVLPGVRTTALVGGKPVAVVAGLPGESVEIDTRFPGPKDRPREQISGRVVDASGRPVTNAIVRVTDASGIDARAYASRTDEAGGFTVHGLRPGVRYRLAAEAEDGPLDLSGEQEARAPESNVRIALLPSGSAATRDAPSTEPQRVSNRPAPEDAGASRPLARTRLASDDGDALPPVREAEALTPRDELPKPADPSPNDAWRPAGSDTPEIGPDTLSFPDPPAPTAGRSAFGMPIEPEEGPDPLPPAIDRSEAFQAAPSSGAIVGAEPAHPASGQFELADESYAEPLQSPADHASPSKADSGFIAAPVMSPGPMDPVAQPSSAPPEEPGFASEPPSLSDVPPMSDPPSEPASTPAPEEFGPAVETPENGPPSDPPTDDAPPALETPDHSGSEEDALPPVVPPGGDLDLIDQPGRPTGSFEPPPEVSRSGVIPEMTARAPEPSRPTWGDLTAQSAQKRASAYPPSSRRLSKSEKPASRGLIASLRGHSEKPASPKEPEVVRASCSFDRRENRLEDFTLPDLQGRPVRFRDIDSDYVLIDFWGTWCGPCLRSVPHLVQLQNRYDPKRLRVIGVAYEQTGPEEGAQNVREAMRQLGINYPVLLGQTGEGPCPVQSAFHIQAYPTMVLVDRHGRILWRESGSNPMTMTRLDRVIASNTRANPGVLRR